MEDPRHMENLIRAHLLYLSSLARYYTKNNVTAQDLLQETMLRIWRFREKFEAGTNFKAWASLIMRNLFINDYRRWKKQRDLTEGIQKQLLRSGKQRVSNTGELLLNYEAVKDKVQELKETYSRPLLLLEAGYSYKEIAATMQLSIGTVKSRIHTARSTLKSTLLPLDQ